MFIVSNAKENALAEIVDVAQVTTNDYTILKSMTLEFLKKNELGPEMIDLLILGKNGDVRTDGWYKEFHDVLFQDKPVLTFKNLVGEYRTASAFGMYLGVRILSGEFKNIEVISEEVRVYSLPFRVGFEVTFRVFVFPVLQEYHFSDLLTFLSSGTV